MLFDTGILGLVAGEPPARFVPIVLSDDALAGVGVVAGDLAIFERVTAIEAGAIVLADLDAGGSVMGRFVPPAAGRAGRGYVATLRGCGRQRRHRLSIEDWISGRLVEARHLYGARYASAGLDIDGVAMALIAN